jgi:CheY-like chemotaxis protein
VRCLVAKQPPFERFLNGVQDARFSAGRSPAKSRRKASSLNLDRLGAKVVVARNGFEGLDAIKSNHPNMVLSDIAMPGMHGFELLRQIQALDAAPSSKVPVVAMSAFFTDADRAQVLYAGFKACLPKPFSPEKLVETILTVLND